MKLIHNDCIIQCGNLHDRQIQLDAHALASLYIHQSQTAAENETIQAIYFITLVSVMDVFYCMEQQIASNNLRSDFSQ